MTFDRPDRRNYRTWPETTRAEVLPVAGLLTRNADIDLRRDELVWVGRNQA